MCEFLLNMVGKGDVATMGSMWGFGGGKLLFGEKILISMLA